MQLDSKVLIPLIYLWTKDANMEPGPETEKYILDQLSKIRSFANPTYSDAKRAHMSTRIHNLMLNLPIERKEPDF